MSSSLLTGSPAWNAAGWTMLHMVWVGAAIGLTIAALLLPRARQLIGSQASMPGVVIAAGFACAIILALLSGAIPAWRGLRLSVAAALARH